MRAEILLELKDEPGALLRALKPISSHGANVFGISHLREKMRDSIVPTLITLEIPDGAELERIKESLAREKVKIARISIEGKRLMNKKAFSAILIGHVIDTNVQDTIDRLIAAGANVETLSTLIPDPKDVSSSIFNIEADASSMKKILGTLDAISAKKNLLVIREID
jgi:ACT domain-containing protein